MISQSNKKFFLQTWFIALMFACWFLYGIPAIVGIVLIILQSRENKKLLTKYGDHEQITAEIDKLKADYKTQKESQQAEFENSANILNQKIDKLQADYQTKKESQQAEFEINTRALNKAYANMEAKNKTKIESLKSEIHLLSLELDNLSNDALIAHYNFSDYDGLGSEECKNKLSLLKVNEQELVKSGEVFLVASTGSKKEISDNKKQIIRCFNAECDNLLINLTAKNIDTARNKIAKSFESLNKIFSVDGISLTQNYLELKLEELNLVYTFALKREQEKEQQKAIKEQMIEEEKVRREIERQKAKIEKDQTQCNNEIKKLLGYVQKTSSDVEKQLYIDKIKEIEDKLSQLENEKETVTEREANARAGFVYVISNIGSFGEDIYKIGMTRRLEPMDRIKELSSASVPFEFDVHAMIFSDDAPELENILHKHFEKKSVNRVNLRKEFFHVTLDEIEKVVIENFNNTVEFTRIPVAQEYRQTQLILESENS